MRSVIGVCSRATGQSFIPAELQALRCSGTFRANRDSDLVATVNEKEWRPLSGPAITTIRWRDYRMDRVNHFRAASLGIAFSRAADWLTLGLIEHGSSTTPACAPLHVERSCPFWPADRSGRAWRHADRVAVSQRRHRIDIKGKGEPDDQSHDLLHSCLSIGWRFSGNGGFCCRSSA